MPPWPACSRKARSRRSRRVVPALVLPAALACGGDERSIAVPEGDAGGFVVETIARGLEVPWGLALAADGRLFVTERPGRLRVIVDDSLRTEPWATLPVREEGEAGLMGVATAPDFATSGHVYVVGTFADGGALVNRVIRFTERDGRGADPTVIIDGIPAARFHAGDAIAFGRDGMLYVATGDARDPGNAEDLGSLAGKILRYRPDGGIPADNPVPGSPVWASGLRNPQGLAWDPESGQLFATDHGPSGFPNERFRTGNDELNAIVPGGDYGWPSIAGTGGGASRIDPVVVWDPAIAPSGLAVYSSDAIPGWRGSLFVAALSGRSLRRVSVSPASGTEAGWRASAQERLLEGYGRLRSVLAAPDGALYVGTSNRDGRGSPTPDDDRILRLSARR
ncbi:MAG TPA: PQQ-dependent sugar dehydrogenase [Gemmatimonadaceae bacterium]|nr:PQQ-dependent sugar dehydrogenase [Gemmatimonadaceae bacterium]